MKKLFVVMSTVLLMLGVGTSRSFATAPDASTQDEQWDINGSTNGYNLNNTVPGNVVDNMNGTGTITITVLGTSCSTCFVDTLVDEQVGTAFFNEYATNTAGAGPQGGWTETWEAGYINEANSPEGAIYTDAAGTLIDTLTNTNTTDGGVGGSNFSNNCTGTCNGDVAIALGADFNLTSDEEEVITVTASTTQPGSGFYIEQTNPDDVPPTGGPGQVSNIYFTETAVEQPACVGDQCQPPPPPPAVPEPNSLALLATGLLGFGMMGLRRRFSFGVCSKALGVLAVFALGLVAAPFANAQTVNTVPEVPTNPAAPHTAYTGATVVLGATFTGFNPADSYSYKWSFGDTTSGAVTAMTNSNDLSTTHVYSVEADGVTPATVGYTWTAVLTVIDNTASVQYTGNYLVIWENNTLSSRVNVAIDKGLWYLHQAMYHPGAPTASGWWDDNCAAGYSYLTGGCGIGSNYGSLDATNVQAFEVNGHLASGPASDPYTSDVSEGLTRMLGFLTYTSNAANTVTYNPALYNFGCSDGTAPTTTQTTVSTPSSPSQGYCDAGAVEVYYTPNSTACTSPNCSYTFDGNSDTYMVYAPNYDNMGYEQGMYIDALVASTTPGAQAPASASGPIANMTYQNIVQDMVDWTNYCQYGSETYDVEQGYARGEEPYEGGGWWYACHQGGDNSVSQWASIGLIAANRGFGITIPTVVTDLNNYWVTLSQDVQQAKPTGLYSYNSGDDYGSFGYNGSLDYSNAWGSFATTPSGMVQMSLDGIGRTNNTAFGAGSNAPDQRFNNVETYYADNFCNSPTDGPVTSPRAYTYGMFSFTKAMLLHNPGGVLTPIQYLRSQTANTFTGDSSDPANTIDWYAALSPANGGTDACDGVAQTLLSRQLSGGSWSSYNGSTPYQADYNGDQYYYETAWAIIMLQKTVFVNCVNNLVGAGAMGNAKTAARIDLTWTGIPNVTGYNVLISNTSGGPYTQVVYNGGTTTGTAFSDRSGLTNGQTYYFVLQPINGGGAVCQSNQATVTVP